MSGRNYPRPTSWDYPEVVQSAIQQVGGVNRNGDKYFNHGLAYKPLPVYVIARMKAVDAAGFADVVTQAYPDASGENQFQYYIPDEAFSGMNGTSIANVAYISLYANNPQLRVVAAQLLERIQDFCAL